MLALFGQVLGAVPLNDLPADGDPSAWSLDPRARTFYVIADPEHPFVYTPDGPDGPIDLGVPTERDESPSDALDLVRRLANERRRAK